MSDPSYVMQLALASALLGDTSVSGLIDAEVSDELDAANAPYPRVEIGESHWAPETNGCGDPGILWETVNVWASGPGGRLLAKQIASAVLAVIGPQRSAGALVSPALTLPGYTIVSVVIHDARHTTELDPTEAAIGLVARSTLLLAYQLSPTA